MTANLTLLGLVYITRCGWGWPADRVVRLGSSCRVGSVSGHRAFSSCSHLLHPVPWGQRVDWNDEST